ncbi:hypothetical protein H4R19_002031 [Coemansia spiralis]|nr:hypothetical protein H4R19_002031 [Coemansia spiralis]
MSFCTDVHAGGEVGCERPAEVLPPYSPLDPSDEGLDGSDEIAPALPTDMAVSVGAELTSAAQLLLPVGGLAVTLEGFANVRATVRVASTGSLLGVAAVFDHGGSGPAVIASSTVDEKTSRRMVRFVPGPGLMGVRVVCTITVPRSAALDELALRLPAGSQLEIEQVGRAMVQRLDVAVISGSVWLSQVGAGRVRVAVGSGTIDAFAVDADEAAEFIACSGRVRVGGCAAKVIRSNTPGARLTMSDLHAEALSISGRQAEIAVSAVAAKSVTVATCAGAVTLDAITTESLDVRTETAPVRGSWAIGRRVSIVAGAAMVQGRLSLASNEVHAAISTSGWPVQLAVSDSFRGFFDVTAAGSIANVGFAAATAHERRPHRVQGVVGTGPSSLRITNARSPIVVTTF